MANTRLHHCIKKELIYKVFPYIAWSYKNLKWISTRAITNNDVNAINFSIQNGIPDEVTTYKSIDTVMNHDEVVNYPPKGILEFTGFVRSATAQFNISNWDDYHSSL